MDDHTVAGRMLAIIDAVASRAYIGLAEITAITSIPKPTVRRIVEDLVRRGKLERTPLGYGLGSLRSLGQPSPQYQLSGVGALLDSLRERFGGVAWFSDSGDRALTQPTLAVSEPPLRRLVATAWPDPRSTDTFTQTAYGHAVLAVRPDLLDRLVYTQRREGVVPRQAGVAEHVRRGLDRGAFLFEDAASGWRCVAIRSEARPAPMPGSESRQPKAAGAIVGVIVPRPHTPARELIAGARAVSESLMHLR